MIKNRIFLKKYKHLLRKFSTALRPTVSLDKNVDESIKQEAFKPRKHPGIMTAKTIALPDRFIKAAQSILEDYPIKNMLPEANALVRHLKNRVAPMERHQVRQVTENIHTEVLNKVGPVTFQSEEERKLHMQSVKDKVLFRLKKTVYNWKPMDYSEYNALLYLLGRCAPEYAVLMKTFSEIKQRDQGFQPKSFFDFGSGIGTAMWACNSVWKESLVEYFNVDSSSSMNDLSQILLQDGKGNKEPFLRGVYYRQFLPAKNNTYDLVVSAYSFLELPSVEARIDALINLWNKTSKYLVLVEYGTNGGFRVINEARDFILHITNEHNKGHVFSPCPHHYSCPRFSNVDDNTPCNFQVKYYTLPFGQSSEVRRELYSYVVLKKGARDADDKLWPRIVRETLVRPRHTICRMCTHRGKLEEAIFTASRHGKTAYHCARSSEWGDLLPIKVEDSKASTD